MLAYVPRDLVLDPELFAFKFNDSEIVGMRPVDFLVDCALYGRMLDAQRRYTLICCHSGPPMSYWYLGMVDQYAADGKQTTPRHAEINLC